MNNKSEQAGDPSKRLLGPVRKARIAELIRSRGFMSNGALAAEFGVSEMTVRRDLAELGIQGELLRTHGGAVARDGRPAENAHVVELSFDDRSRTNRDAKARIAAAAERLVKRGHAIVLDVGTTTYELAARLATRDDVKVFTNDLRIAALLAMHCSEIYVLGGRVRQREMSLCGPMAAQQARRLWFETAFIGVSGVTPNGFFDYSIEEAEMKRTFLNKATHKVVLCDASKFDRRSLVRVAALREINTLITDAAPPPELAGAFKTAGVTVLVAT